MTRPRTPEEEFAAVEEAFARLQVQMGRSLHQDILAEMAGLSKGVPTPPESESDDSKSDTDGEDP